MKKIGLSFDSVVLNAPFGQKALIKTRVGKRLLLCMSKGFSNPLLPKTSDRKPLYPPIDLQHTEDPPMNYAITAPLTKEWRPGSIHPAGQQSSFV